MDSHSSILTPRVALQNRIRGQVSPNHTLATTPFPLGTLRKCRSEADFYNIVERTVETASILFDRKGVAQGHLDWSQSNMSSIA